MPATSPDPIDFSAAAAEWRRHLILKKDRNGELQPVPCWQNVALLLRHHPAWQGCLALDEFANRIVLRKSPEIEGGELFRPGPWEAHHEYALGLWLAQQRPDDRLVLKPDAIDAGVTAAAQTQPFHPVREHLERAARAWDGVPRLKMWLVEFCNVPQSIYSMLVGRYFLLGMVARVFEPGCQMRSVLILEGAQDIGKSAVLRALAQPWFSDTNLDLHNKDSFGALRGIWLQEFAELDSLSRADATRVKSFISSRVDRYRAPYERATRDWPRQTVFGGSTNLAEYFKDPSGNTRFLPVAVSRPRVDELAGVRDQLMGEAVVRYRQRVRRFPPSEIARRHFAIEQEAREIADPWDSILARYVANQVKEHSREEPLLLRMDQLLTEGLKIEVGKIDGARQMATRVGISMRKLGWLKRRSMADGDRGYHYEEPAASVLSRRQAWAVAVGRTPAMLGAAPASSGSAGSSFGARSSAANGSSAGASQSGSGSPMPATTPRHPPDGSPP
jgi:predicted P-loop ATPase